MTSLQFYLDHNQELEAKRLQKCITKILWYIPHRRRNSAIVWAPVPRYLEHKSGTFCNWHKYSGKCIFVLNNNVCITYSVIFAAPSPKVFDGGVRQSKNLIWLQRKCQHYLQWNIFRQVSNITIVYYLHAYQKYLSVHFCDMKVICSKHTTDQKEETFSSKETNQIVLQRYRKKLSYFP